MRPASQNYGPGALVVSQGIYEESSTQKQRIGERLSLGERTFYYAKASGAIKGGYLVEAAALGGATTTLQNTCAVTVAAPLDTVKVYVNALSNAQTANTFADGWAAIWDASGTLTAYLYYVKSNTALATSGVTSYITLYDPLHVALTTSDQISLMANRYKDVVTLSSATTLAGDIVGVAPITITTGGYYFWLQTWGPCAVIPTAALDFDDYVSSSDTTVGEVEADAASANTQILGSPMHIGTAAEAAIMYLRLAP